MNRPPDRPIVSTPALPTEPATAPPVQKPQPADIKSHPSVITLIDGPDEWNGRRIDAIGFPSRVKVDNHEWFQSRYREDVYFFSEDWFDHHYRWVVQMLANGKTEAQIASALDMPRRSMLDKFRYITHRMGTFTGSLDEDIRAAVLRAIELRLI